MKSKMYYVYVRGILGLYALVYTSPIKEEASNVAKQYQNSKVTLSRLNF
jgi:hypothetical protein